MTALLRPSYRVPKISDMVEGSGFGGGGSSFAACFEALCLCPYDLEFVVGGVVFV